MRTAKKKSEFSVVVRPDGKPEMAVSLSGDPFRNSDDRRPLHEEAIDGAVYRAFLSELKDRTGIVEATATAYAADLLASQKPRDGMERMLLTHALWCHGRITKLNMMLASATRLQDVRTLSELVDRASNDFRKSMLALAEYRRPRRKNTFTQINRANQQVVQNGGSNAEPKKVTARVVRALPPAEVYSRRPRSAAKGDPKDEAVASIHRTTNRRG